MPTNHTDQLPPITKPHNGEEYNTDEYKISQLNARRTTVVNVERAKVLGPEPTALARVLNDRPALFLLSPTADHLYGTQLRRAEIGIPNSHIYVVNTGEHNKNTLSVTDIVSLAQHLGFSRDGVFVAVGGGILLDIVGFAASQFRRGIAHIKIGTTLVAQVDAAVGIKCGVNLKMSKNLIGSFYPPEHVLTDGEFLTTVQSRDIRCGLAEMIKLGVIADRELFDALDRNAWELLDPTTADSDASRWLVDKSITSMIAELESDPYENHLCRRVDFGHTISPRLEVETNYQLRHGEAVAIDLALFSVVSNVLGSLPDGDLSRILNLLHHLRIPTWHELLSDVALLDSALNAAEAHRGRRINLPLPIGIGKALFLENRQELPTSLLNTAIRRLRKAQR